MELTFPGGASFFVVVFNNVHILQLIVLSSRMSLDLGSPKQSLSHCLKESGFQSLNDHPGIRSLSPLYVNFTFFLK